VNEVAELLRISTPRALTLVLVLARVAGLMVFAPLLGSRNLSPRVRSALALAITAALVPALPIGRGVEILDAQRPFALLLALMLELAVGVVIGLVAEFIFSAVSLAGQLAGMEMGLGLAGLIDPQTQDRVTAIAQWQTLLAMLIFLSVDGHHLLIQAIAESFRAIPPGLASIGPAGVSALMSLAGQIFVISLKIAAPVLVLILLVNGAMGALAKLIPQLNVMVVGFPINVAVGFFILTASQPFTVRILEQSFGSLAGSLAGLLASSR
jgi:flagellar biosynthetic protein FliR